MTVEEATKKADELGLEGDVRDGFIKIRSGATTPKPAPAKVAVAVVKPPAAPKAPPKPDKVAILAATPPEEESNYDTSDASVEQFDVNPEGEPSGKVIALPQTQGLPTVQRAVAVARERPVRSPQEQAEGFRPRLSPTSAVLHAIEGSPAPAVVVTKAPVLPPGMDARRQMVANLLGMPDDSAPPASSARPAYTSTYDTILSPDDEAKFQAWAKANNRLGDLANYDMRGAWKSGAVQAGNGHFPDTYKKPNHPTFSTESIYAKVVPGAGTWNGDSFVAGPANLNGRTAAQLQADFAQQERGTGATLVLPSGGKGMSPDALRAYDAADQATRDSFDALLTDPRIKPEELQIAILTPEGQAKIRRIANPKR